MTPAAGGWLPPGLFDYGSELADELEALLGRGLAHEARHLIDAPARLGMNDEPPAPVRWGSGALCVDLVPDDEETWQRFAELHVANPDPEAVAAAAQEWRLAVTPYRRLPNSARASSAGSDGARCSRERFASSIRRPAPTEGAMVVDLTSMWAGPLCTELLAEAGARVTKVTSAARPDGLADSPMHAELNQHKTEAELDLRNPDERSCFDELLRSADLLVTSLSTRALANLELLPAQLAPAHPQLRTLAITAFESGSPERDWIAYGTGVHAASGLGWPSDPGEPADAPRAPAYSYPDPLAGLHAAAVAVRQLAGDAAQHQRVSLAGAIAPLVARATCDA